MKRCTYNLKMLFLVLFFKSQVCKELKQGGIYALDTNVVDLTVVKKSMSGSEIMAG